MVWTAEQMIASYGNAMPDSYYEAGLAERDSWRRALEGEAEEWTRITARDCEVELLEYVHADQWLAELRIDGFAPMRFANLEDMREWLDRMFP